MLVHSDLYRDILFKIREVNLAGRKLYRISVGFNENIVILGYVKTIEKALRKIKRSKTTFKYAELKFILTML